MQEPSKQLGWWTALNNLSTQLFLRARVIFIYFIISAVLTAAWTVVSFSPQEARIWRQYLYLIWLNIIGRSIPLPSNINSFFLRLAIHHAIEDLAVFVFIFGGLFFGFRFLFRGLYEKKYLRGTKVIPPRLLFKFLKKEV